MDNRNTTMLSSVPDNSEKLMKVLDKHISKVTGDIEKAIKDTDSAKKTEVQNKINNLREASKVLSTCALDIPIGFKSGLEDINEIIIAMLAEYE